MRVQPAEIGVGPRRCISQGVAIAGIQRRATTTMGGMSLLSQVTLVPAGTVICADVNVEPSIVMVVSFAPTARAGCHTRDHDQSGQRSSDPETSGGRDDANATRRSLQISRPDKPD